MQDSSLNTCLNSTKGCKGETLRMAKTPCLPPKKGSESPRHAYGRITTQGTDSFYLALSIIAICHLSSKGSDVVLFQH